VKGGGQKTKGSKNRVDRGDTFGERWRAFNLSKTMKIFDLHTLEHSNPHSHSRFWME
jgi:hypothetical protein